VSRWIQTLSICYRPRPVFRPQHKGAVGGLCYQFVFVASLLSVFLQMKKCLVELKNKKITIDKGSVFNQSNGETVNL
jgi:hypothetical protein